MKKPARRQEPEAMYVSTLFPPREIKKERLVIALTTAEKTRLENLSAQLGVTQSALIRRAVDLLYETQSPAEISADLTAGMTRR